MADGSTKPIEEIEVGDWVWAADPETGEQGPRQVTDLIVGEGHKDLVDIVIDGDLVTATNGHPFWVDDLGRWVDAEDVESEDLLLLADGSTAEVDRVSKRSAVQRVHNLTVEGIHTYFVVVGDDEVLVHNCRKPASLSPPGAGRHGAFHQAKRDSGIPVSQQPTRVGPNRDRSGQPQPGRIYEFDVPAAGGSVKTIRIREDSGGHLYPDPSQNRGPHFNTEEGGHYDY